MTLKPQIEAWIENGRIKVHVDIKSGWVTTSAGNRLYLTDGGDLQTSPGGPSIYVDSGGGSKPSSSGGAAKPASSGGAAKPASSGGMTGVNVKADFGKLQEALSEFSFKSFSEAKDKPKFVKEAATKVAKSFGLSTKVEMVSDKEMDAAFSRAHVSRVGGMVRGRVTAGYKSDTNTVYMRESEINSPEAVTGFAHKVMQVAFHEIGHSYHAEKLGVTKQDLKSNYGTGWAERFAVQFSGTLAWNQRTQVIRDNPDKFRNENMRREAANYNPEKAMAEDFKSLYAELAGASKSATMVKSSDDSKTDSLYVWVDGDGVAHRCDMTQLTPGDL